MKIRVTIDLTNEQVEFLKAFARDTYKPSLEITWRTVAEAWAAAGLKETIERIQSRPATTKENP